MKDYHKVKREKNQTKDIEISGYPKTEECRITECNLITSDSPIDSTARNYHKTNGHSWPDRATKTSHDTQNNSRSLAANSCEPRSCCCWLCAPVVVPHHRYLPPSSPHCPKGCQTKLAQSTPPASKSSATACINQTHIQNLQYT